MDTTIPPCPECRSEYGYADRDLLICPECGHEWLATPQGDSTEGGTQFKDANGNILLDGDHGHRNQGSQGQRKFRCGQSRHKSPEYSPD